FVATIAGAAGAWIAIKERRGELALLYGGLALLAFWASFGPAAGLYSVLYDTMPLFVWLRAPARFGVLTGFGLAVLTGIAMSGWLKRTAPPSLLALVVALIAAGELAVPLRFPPVQPVAPVYRMLATLPRGAVIEMPFYYPQVGVYQHAKYMLAS